uniref:Protein LTV1 homolog n=1 Tax=Sinocyclocheilus rhinocerous TaxID=307959 RepID=A0A673GBA3_9TELE
MTPHRKKKAFISKENAVSFHLVHRSQKDPLAADETAPQHVLLPAAKVEVEKRKEEQRNFGVFFDDDYNYLQHLREAPQPAELVSAPRLRRDARPKPAEDEEDANVPTASIKLPSSVFASEFEEEVGLLNKAAPVSGPRLDMDPDIVAALDEDFDFDDPENMLEDDFIIKANDVMGGDDDDDEWEDTDEDDDEDEEQDCDSEGGLSEDEEGGRREFMFADCETKSRFTEYSLTSSVMRRNEQLTLLDDRFEKFYEQFDDDEIGALDNAELEGYIEPDSKRLEEVIKDYFIQKEKECQKPDQLGPAELPDWSNDVENSALITGINYILIYITIENSTYSNLYNRPKLIQDPPKVKKPIRVSDKTGIPLDVLPKRGLTAKQVERMERINDSDLPRASTQPRSRDESAEERRARKQTIKTERKERRSEKKANKLAFKQEKQMQEKQMVNLRANVQGLKLS